MFDSLIADLLCVRLFSIYTSQSQHPNTTKTSYSEQCRMEKRYLVSGLILRRLHIPMRHVGSGRANAADGAHGLGGFGFGACTCISMPYHAGFRPCILRGIDETERTADRLVADGISLLEFGHFGCLLRSIG